MKPNYDEIRRILTLSITDWHAFLNELNSTVLGKSYLPDETFFGQFYQKNHCPALQEALIIIAFYWERVSEKVLKLATTGLEFTRPLTCFIATLIRSSDETECSHLVSEATRIIDQIEFPILSKTIFGKLDFNLDEPEQISPKVRNYDEQMLGAAIHHDPIVKAGIQLQLIQRGFTI